MLWYTVFRGILHRMIDRRRDNLIYDISQPLFECCVYPGDSRPEKRSVRSMEKGDAYNLTDISLCVHNGTHVDAPSHFIRDGKGIDRIRLEKFIGHAYVACHEGKVTAQDARSILDTAAAACEGAQKKILLKGNATVTLEAAKVFAEANTDLIRNESQTVGPEDSPKAVHLVLLGAETVLLEGIRLTEVPAGVYFLNCAPLNLTDTDGAPCRAILMEV